LFYNGIPIGSRGNIVAINGKAKSRKSVIASAIMSSAFCDGFLGFTTKLGGEPRVLNFDTEQGLGHWIEGSRRVIRDAGHYERPPGFHSHHTRDCTVEMRIELLEYALGLYTPDIVVVDGVTDLVYDLNSQEEATRIGGKLMQWSVKFNCLVVAIIHITKGTGYMTGAVGTYLEKKCQTAIKCEKDEKDEGVSWIACQYARDKGFAPFGIMYDEADEVYVRVSDEQTQSSGPRADNGPATKSEEVRARMLSATFGAHTGIPTEHTLKIKINQAARMTGIGELKKKDTAAWIAFFFENGLIVPHPEFGHVKGEFLTKYTAHAPELGLDQTNPVDDLFGGDEPDLPF
jgi:hypothetical protein